MSDEAGGTWMRVSEAAGAFGLSTATLRRLCDQGVLPARRSGRNWEVQSGNVRAYVLARPSAGAPRASIRLQGPATRYHGAAPNARLRDAEGFLFGWRFRAAIDPRQEVLFSIWLSRELVQIVQGEGRDPRELVVRAAESLAQQVALERETLPSGHEILLTSRDRVRLLRAAGSGPNDYRPSEAPPEEGALVIYEFTARDTVWVGDSLGSDHHPDQWADVVVGWSYMDGRRRVRTVRLRRPDTKATRRADAVRAAIAAYRRRCRRLHQRPGEWLADVEAQLRATAASRAKRSS